MFQNVAECFKKQAQYKHMISARYGCRSVFLQYTQDFESTVKLIVSKCRGDVLHFLFWIFTGKEFVKYFLF